VRSCEGGAVERLKMRNSWVFVREGHCVEFMASSWVPLGRRPFCWDGRMAWLEFS
jgi:hypothetical protein